MAYDLEEQEQLENIKAWWRQYGNFLTWLLIACLLAFAAWNGWNWWQRKQAGEAAVLYEQVLKAAEARDVERTKRAAGDLEDKYGKTAYGQMTALVAAKVLYEAGDLAGAKSQLQWAVDHGDGEYQHLARVRLAGVLLDEKAYDQGLALLKNEPPSPFVALYADRRGDLLAAQDKRDEARAAYRQALDKLGVDEAGMRQIIQFKLDALGTA
ncbi:tetratricopeptide repeat protein [Cupriavidus gilardii]|uniref:Ancillary SecYEG translocon subunit n=1 Tax=Cupriavidus gilardii TaxID=82541 RepID=A0A6N1BHJ0_9BURK|nr:MULTISPECIES: tetratricopeptide repeat protein [Cupriavidus]ALD90923.1 transmembrane protein [Cupriavidus gilardii CR3]QQE05974.1 tetratricopeptide repeat protein [Cupriavidus sp. ISTL7]ESJ22349.1 membrane protein [Cupriavidus sp. HPC(L)]KAB0594179.1 tetratricopeptide repeat protein [Cupriavidus gilardii]MCD9123862.1 tetratricopeptide repeat protein [Cupriavidus sp. UGS-1]